MGCDIHAVLQHKTTAGDWETILIDVIQSRDYTLFGWLSSVRGYIPEGYTEAAQPGLPKDFTVDSQNRHMFQHEKFWIGEHSYGHINLNEFCKAPVPEQPERKYPEFNVDVSVSGVDIEFEELDTSDEYSSVRALQYAYDVMFGYHFDGMTGESTIDYRLVFGYDS